MRLGAAGTHPFSLFEHQKITARDRYRALVEMLQYVARRELVFGMHVHVAVPDAGGVPGRHGGRADRAAGAARAVGQLAVLARRARRGLASTRAMIFAAFPRSGLPPRFADYQDYAEAVGFMEATGAIGDYTHLWWDVRPHPRFGTIELRVMDVPDPASRTRSRWPPTCSAWSSSCSTEFEDGDPPLSYHRMLVAENKWLAARYGLDAPLMDLAGRQAGEDAGAHARPPAAARAAADRPRAGLRRRSWPGSSWILEKGTGADRQLQVCNANRDIVEVAEEIAAAAERV